MLFTPTIINTLRFNPVLMAPNPIPIGMNGNVRAVQTVPVVLVDTLADVVVVLMATTTVLPYADRDRFAAGAVVNVTDVHAIPSGLVYTLVGELCVTIINRSFA
jgi:hypothetical protein